MGGVGGVGEGDEGRGANRHVRCQMVCDCHGRWPLHHIWPATELCLAHVPTLRETTGVAAIFGRDARLALLPALFYPLPAVPD
eukprot:scaffold5738_cov61-Phaeocystis_antarctica.AAC.11